MAVVVRAGPGAPRTEDLIGVVSKEHVADAVAETVRIYPQRERPPT